MGMTTPTLMTSVNEVIKVNKNIKKIFFYSFFSIGEKAFLINLIDNIFNFNYIQIFYSNNI